MLNRKKIPTIIVALFVVVVFAASSLIAIILAQGRRFDTDEGLGFVQTSIIRLNSIPEDVNVYINEKPAQITDNKIEFLDPGNVNVTVEKEGYTPWQKVVHLDPGIITDVNVQLFPNTLEFEAITALDVDQAIFSDDSQTVFYTILNSEVFTDNGIWRYRFTRSLLNLNEERPTKMVSFTEETLAILRKGTYTLKISKDNARAIIYSKEDKLLNVFDLNTSQLINVNASLFNFPEKIDWFRNSDSLIVLANNLLYEYEISSNQQTIITFGSVKSPAYYIGNDFVIYWRFDLKSFYVYKGKISNAFVFKELLPEIEDVVDVRGIAYDEQFLIFVTSQNDMFISDVKKEFRDRITDVTEISSLTKNGRSMILNRNGFFYSYNLSNSVDNRSYLTKLTSLNIQKSAVNLISFLENNKSIVVIKPLTETTRTMTVMDSDGENRKDYFSDSRLTLNPPILSPNGAELYMVLNEVQGQTTVENIYKIILLR